MKIFMTKVLKIQRTTEANGKTLNDKRYTQFAHMRQIYKTNIRMMPAAVATNQPEKMQKKKKKST